VARSHRLYLHCSVVWSSAHATPLGHYAPGWLFVVIARGDSDEPCATSRSGDGHVENFTRRDRSEG